LIDEQITAVVVGIIVVIAVANASNFYLSNRVVEPFSELGILGPNQKIADYPKQLKPGQNFTLYLYVGNHEGKAMDYTVYAKLGNRSSVVNENVSMASPPTASYGIVLASNSTYLAPITMSLKQPGNNTRLVFELWTYQSNTSSFVYDHRWVQLWLNLSSAS
jgi:uncharacterized membrane protein